MASSTRDKLERDPDGAQALQVWIAAGHPLANHTYYASRPHQERGRGFPEGDPAQRAGAGAADAPKSGQRRRHDWHWFRYPYLHEGDTLEKRRAVRAFLRLERLPHRADHHRLGGLPVEQRTRALRGRSRMRAAIEWLRSSYLAEAETLDARAARSVAPGLGPRHQSRRAAAPGLVQLAHPAGPVRAAGARGLSRSSRSKRRRAIRSTTTIRTSPTPRGGTLTELMMQAKRISLARRPRRQAAREAAHHLRVNGDMSIDSYAHGWTGRAR